MIWQTDLKTDGYALLPGLVPEPLITEARQAIIADIDAHYDPARRDEYDGMSWCPDIRGAPALMDLLHKSPVWDMLDQALGAGAFGHGVAQVAIRKAHNSAVEDIGDFHIDGVPSDHNGLSGDEISNFTALVGSYLTSTPRLFSGNFTLWPGSHLGSGLINKTGSAQTKRVSG